GPSLSPFNAWLLVKGLETLEMRVRRQCEVALAVARFLEKHPKVKRTLYPGLASHPQHDLAAQQMTGFGSVVCFEAGTSKDQAFRVMNALKLVDISNNLGDTKSLSTHPATTTHRRLSPEERAALGISDAFIRISAGIEDEADLIADLDQALKQI
ncbi:MAG: PLP-dependent transferase, partial [Alphaproteobacteria bacterium]|nr:PLP-dependent transferase [Alphaproteobacteria bacterium]